MGDAIKPLPYTDDELLGVAGPRRFSGEHLNEIAFPLGGIGTGCVSLSGRGSLVDWEIFNRPNKGYRPHYTFMSLHVQEEGEEPIFRVLEGTIPPSYQGRIHNRANYAGFGWGPAQEDGGGLARFRECEFVGTFPTADVNLSDDSVPVTARISAWSPFIPLNDRDSSFPVAVLDITLTNTSAKPVKATTAVSLQNICGYPEAGQAVNRLVRADDYRGIAMSSNKHDAESPRHATLAVLTDHEDITWELGRERGAWFTLLENLVFKFGESGRFSEDAEEHSREDDTPVFASLGLMVDLAPGEERTVSFALAWHVPNAEKYWGPQDDCCDGPCTWKNYYASQWDSAEAVAAEVIRRRGELLTETVRFRDELFASTLPGHVVDAVSSQLAILRSPTVMRLPDGTMYGWEGCHPESGCCEGTCTHVWNYAQSVAYIFPAIARGMREMDFEMDLRESDGHMQFRMSLPPGTPANHEFHAAADGQMGNVLRVYREWLQLGDEEWLAKLWPGVKKALEYAWVEWDADKDGLLEGVHHNTLDIEYHGPNTAVGSLYLAALRAGEKMARHVGDNASADEYARIAESGRNLSDEQLYNGEYYYQKITNPDAPYQFGTGCHVDQVLGQWYARMLGLGDLYDPERVRSAIASVFRYNFREDFHDHNNPHRVYVLNDDAGTMICTWPKGGMPWPPVTYAFECMIGFEYQAGAHMVYEGFVKEGLTVCKAIRDRHDGLKRNPWNEFECGSHYARSMANYAYILALSGWRYSAVEKRLEFAPKVHADNFRGFFSTDSGYGSIYRKVEGDTVTVTVAPAVGSIAIERIALEGVDGKSVIVRLGDTEVAAAVEGGEVVLADAVSATAEAPLAIVLS